MKREEMVSISVRESLGRTINTTLTTLVTIVPLYILGAVSYTHLDVYKRQGRRAER